MQHTRTKGVISGTDWQCTTASDGGGGVCIKRRVKGITAARSRRQSIVVEWWSSSGVAGVLCAKRGSDSSWGRYRASISRLELQTVTRPQMTQQPNSGIALRV